MFPIVAVFVVFDGAIGDDAGVEPWVSDVFDSVHFCAAVWAFEDDFVDPRFMGRMSFEFVPSFDGASFEFIASADDVELFAFVAYPYREGQAPESFFGDHPIAHIGEPFDFAIFAEGGDPFDIFGDCDNFIAPIHIDIPLVDHAEDEFFAGAPAVRVDVWIEFLCDEDVLFLELGDDGLSRFVFCRIHAREETEFGEEASGFVERCELW